MLKSFSNFIFVTLMVVVLILISAGKVYAYLDPGTGSMILQGILGGLAAAAVVVRLYWHRLLVFFGIRKDPSRNDKEEQYTENSEQSNLKGDGSK